MRISRIIGLASFFLFGLFTCKENNTNKNKSGINKTENKIAVEIIKKAVDSFQLPSMSAAVYKDGKLVFNYAYGIKDIKSELPVTNNDPYHIGSVTKSFTSTIVGFLVEEGRLNWETKIIDIFPELDSLNSIYSNVNLTQLLSHTSGLIDLFSIIEWRTMKYDTTVSPSIQKSDLMIRAIKNSKNGVTGKDWAYANVNYTIASLMAEKVSGKTWYDLMQTYIADELDIKMGFGWAKDSETRTVPKGHVMIADIREGYTVPEGSTKLSDKYEIWGPDFSHKIPISIQPAGDVYMKVSDLAKFGNYHIKGLKYGTKKLSKENFKVIHTPIKEGYGLGWNISPDEGYPNLPNIIQHQHPGSGGTFTSVLAIFPEENVSIALIHNGGGNRDAIGNTLTKLAKLFVNKD